jgi:hypothetical protein
MVGKHASLVLIIVLTTLSKKQTASGGILGRPTSVAPLIILCTGLKVSSIAGQS